MVLVGAPGAELDLLLRQGDRFYWVEMKRTDAPQLTTSLRTAQSDLGLERAVIVYQGGRRYALGERVEAVPLAQLATRDSPFGP